MILAIISFAIQIILLTISGVSEDMTQGFAIFVIVSMILCTIVSIICIIYNSFRTLKMDGKHFLYNIKLLF